VIDEISNSWKQMVFLVLHRNKPQAFTECWLNAIVNGSVTCTSVSEPYQALLAVFHLVILVYTAFTRYDEQQTLRLATHSSSHLIVCISPSLPALHQFEVEVVVSLALHQKVHQRFCLVEHLHTCAYRQPPEQLINPHRHTDGISSNARSQGLGRSSAPPTSMATTHPRTQIN